MNTQSPIQSPSFKEEVGLVKTASDLLSAQIWKPLLLLSLFFLIIAFALSIRNSTSLSIQGQSLPLNVSIRKLGMLGILTLATYLIFFLVPFPLHRYYNLRRVSMGWIADRDWAAAITLAFVLVTLFLLYLSAYKLVQHKNSNRLWFIVLLGALFFSLILLFVFPISSTDIYDYVSRGRISGQYGGNPLIETPNDYPGEPYVELAAWKKDPSAYGPLWEILSGLIGRFAGGRLWNDMLGYKILALLGYLLSTFLITAILKRVAPDRCLAGTLLFAWNPLVLLDGIANGHNDMIMVAFILAAFWILSLAQKRDAISEKGLSAFLYGLLAILFLSLAILIKYIPILLMPLLLLYVLAQKRGLKQKGIDLLLSFIFLALVFFLYYRVFWEWPEISNAILHRTEMFRTSLASLTKLILGIFLQPAWAQGIAATFFLAAFVLGYLLIVFRSASALGMIPMLNKIYRRTHESRWCKIRNVIFPSSLDDGRHETWDVLIRTSLYSFLLYLLLGSLWFWPWYLIWPIALVAITKEEHFAAILIVVSCAGQLGFILWNFVWYWMGIEWETLYVVETMALLLMVVPAIVLYQIHRRREHGIPREPPIP